MKVVEYFRTVEKVTMLWSNISGILIKLQCIWFLWGYDDEVQTDGQQGRIGGQVQGKNTAQLKHQRSLGEAQDGSSGDGKDGGRYQVHKNIYGQYNSNCK